MIIFNHILPCLASFDYFCGSFAVMRVVNRVVVLVASEAVQAIEHILWTHQEKRSSLVLSKVMSNGQKCNKSTN